MEEIKNNRIINNNTKDQAIEPDIYTRRWCCAALSASEATYKKDAESAAEFREVLKDAVMA